MHHTVNPTAATPATLKDVYDRLSAAPELSDNRKRDLRSALSCYAKLVGHPLEAIPLDLGSFRNLLDHKAYGKVSRKRWANLRSDLAAALAASGLQPMLSTAALPLNEEWELLLGDCPNREIKTGLSRLARWASSRGFNPTIVTTAVLDRFNAEIAAMTLVRKPEELARTVAKRWNKLATLSPNAGLNTVAVPAPGKVSDRLAWSEIPASFREEVEDYLMWCRVPDPLADDARGKKLEPTTVKLRRDYIHLAASAVCASGKTVPAELTSISVLVDPEIYRAILRHQLKKWGKITPYLQDLAQGLIVIASEWVKVPADQLAALKKIRGKLGNRQFGLTEKNRTVLRRLDDPRLQSDLVQLPETLWRIATRDLSKTRQAFVDLQNALAIDILLHAPLRIENLANLRYDQHVHWPQGRSKRALIVIGADETKNDAQLELELPLVLSNRLWSMRNEIAPSITGLRPETVFVTVTGKPKSVPAIRVGIERTVLRRLGVHITPHQFRHVAAKLHLDADPGAYESARQLLGHRCLRTTTRFYAGPDTRRAGRAHAELISRLRAAKLKPRLSKAQDKKEG
jgi:integrase